MVLACQRHCLGAVGPFTDDSHSAGEPQPGLHQEAHLSGVVDDHDRRYPRLHGKKVPDAAAAIRRGGGALRVPGLAVATVFRTAAVGAGVRLAQLTTAFDVLGLLLLGLLDVASVARRELHGLL